MVSLMEAAVRRWRELGLLKNCHSGEKGEEKEKRKEKIVIDNIRKKRRKKTDKDWEYNNNGGKRFQQMTLLGTNQTKADVEAFGDKLQAKEDNTFRVAVQNIQTLPVNSRTERSRRVINTIASIESDVFLMSEVKLYWPRIENQDKWFE
jgi:hypothetical protein